MLFLLLDTDFFVSQAAGTGFSVPEEVIEPEVNNGRGKFSLFLTQYYVFVFHFV